MPPEPVIFMKVTSAICGPNDDVEIPRGSEKTDWEVELGIVIGKPAKYVTEADALEHVAGYCVVNDVSERASRPSARASGPRARATTPSARSARGWSPATRCPTRNKLAMWLEVDGQRYQDGSTETMVYKVPFLVSYLSQFMSLQPGDVISTGTPPGVGMGQKPPVFLKPGQTMRLGIEGLGEQTQRTVQA